MKINKKEIYNLFSGFTEYQCILLTKKIKKVTNHIVKNRKDYNSVRKLKYFVIRRRKLLKFLKKNFLRYRSLIFTLGMKLSQ